MKILQGGRVEYVPQFNSAVAFFVPRQHEVTKMIGDRPRYSVFGWFMRPVQDGPDLMQEDAISEEDLDSEDEKGVRKRKY